MIRLGMEEMIQLFRLDCLTRINAESGGERVGLITLAEGEDAYNLTVLHPLEDVSFVRETEQGVKLAAREKGLPELLRAKIVINAAGSDHATSTIQLQQIIAPLDEQLVEINVRPDFLSVHHTDLISVLRRRTKISRHMRKLAEILEPLGTKLWVL